MRRLRAHAEFAQVAQRGGLFSSATWPLKVEKFFFEDQLASALFPTLEALGRTAPYGACNFFDETGPNLSCPLCRVLSVCGAVSPCVCVV